MSYSSHYLLLTAGLCLSLNTQALNSEAIEQQADQSIKALYHSLDALPNTSMTERLNWFSEHFQGRVYVLGSLGEGSKARYDQFPRYRSDAFDCDTYVNTVLALALANSLSNFQQCINKLRYQNGQVTYIKRNHFTSIDWNENNQHRGILKDITASIHDQNNKSVALYANTPLDKPNWYAHKTLSSIRLNAASPKQQQARLEELKEKGQHLKKTTAHLAYIPFSALFPNQKANHYLFAQIPDGAIVEIVRPNWDLRPQIGTYLDISHLGFAFWDKGVLYFSQASSNYGKVVKVPLIGYLEEALASPTIKGINVQIVLPQKPGSC